MEVSHNVQFEVWKTLLADEDTGHTAKWTYGGRFITGQRYEMKKRTGEGMKTVDRGGTR